MKHKRTGLKYLFSEDIQYVSTRKKEFQHTTSIVTIAVIGIFIAFTVGSFWMIHHIFQDNFGRTEVPEYSIYETYEDLSKDFPRTDVEFMSENHKLTGYLYGSDNNEKGIVVVSHGIGSGADGYIKEATYFAKRGYRVLSFNNTGSYDSEGSGTMGLSQSVIDLDAALDFVESQEELEELPVFLYGHSWGGYAVTAILNYDHEIAGVISVAGYNTPMEMMMAWCKPNMGILSYIEYPYIWIYQKFLFGGASNLSATEGINSVDIPVLVVHGTEDEVIAYDGPSIIAHRDEVTNPNAKFVTYDEEGKNTHIALPMSKAATAYVEELDASFEELCDVYEGEENIPEDVLKSWYAKVNRAQASELDEVFMQDAYEFFKEAGKAAVK